MRPAGAEPGVASGGSGLAVRRLIAEQLDHLAPDDPAAIESRRDLRRINRISTQPRIAARALCRNLLRPPRRILEIGAGDGATSLLLGLRLAEKWPGVTMVLLDRHDLVAPETRRAFEAVGWRVEPAVGDVFDWLDRHRSQRFDAVLANLFLHHFDRRLPRLLAGAARLAPLFVATEPRRDMLSLAGSRLVGLIGANAVTRHDAVASVRAGFAGRELTALWPGEGWITEERRAGPFTHLFAARRPDAA